MIEKLYYSNPEMMLDKINEVIDEFDKKEKEILDYIEHRIKRKSETQTNIADMAFVESKNKRCIDCVYGIMHFECPECKECNDDLNKFVLKGFDNEQQDWQPNGSNDQYIKVLLEKEREEKSKSKLEDFHIFSFDKY